MTLSMWNIYDWLKNKGYLIQPLITSGQATLKKASILAADVSDPNTVYIGESINDLRKTDSVYLVNGKDIIYIDNTEYETVFNEVNQMFFFYSSWELEMSKCAPYKDGLQRIINLSHEILKIPIFIYDRSGKVLAISQEYPPDIHYHWKELLTGRIIPENRMEELKKSGNLSNVFTMTGPTYFATSPFKVPYLYSPIIIHGEILAHLVFFATNPPIPKGAIFLMSIMTEPMKNHFEIHYSDYVYNYQMASLIHRLLENILPADNTIISELKHIGWKIDDSYIILVFYEPVEGKPVMRERIGEKLQNTIKHCIKLIFEENLVLLVNLSKLGKTSEHLLKTISELAAPHLNTGCSYSFNDFRNLRLYYEQALLAMNFSGKKGEIAYIRDYALPIINNLLLENPLIASLIHPDLLVLKDYDTKHHTEFFQTLKVYLLTSGNYAAIAKMLHIHRNTAIYRIDRLKELMSCDVEDPGTREYLFLSYYLI